MAAPKKNKFWQARSSHGRKPIFKTPARLKKSCVEYFEWIDSNPLIEAKPFHYQGTVKLSPVPHLRAPTIEGLCIYLDISKDTWANYRKRTKGFLAVTEWTENVMYSHKFSGAAADMFNANIIARDLGLRDKMDHSSKDGSMRPTNVMLVPQADSVEDWQKTMNNHTEAMKDEN